MRTLGALYAVQGATSEAITWAMFDLKNGHTQWPKSERSEMISPQWVI